MILSIFDFDVTLMRPDGTWNTKSVNAARRAYGRGYSVLVTGRPEFQKPAIVKSLMDSGIPFHRVLTVGPLFIGQRKRAEIERLVRLLRPDSVEVWDDREDLLGSYGSLLTALGVEHRLNLVRS